MPDACQYLNQEEEDVIQKFKTLMKNKLTSPVLKEDATLFYRFLTARDFNLVEAEKMLMEHIHWRKVYQVDTILETFKPKEFFLKYIEPNLIGFDKEGNAVVYSARGRLNSTEVVKCITFHDYHKHWVWCLEKTEILIKQQAKKIGKTACVGVIVDLDKFEFLNATSKTSSDLLHSFTDLAQNNYPERMKYLYVINAPSYFVLIFMILKTILSNAMLRKIHVFGYNGWKEKLVEIVDPDVLPAFLGGNRTDPDGDPYCSSFVTLPGKIPERYYLTEEERHFKDLSKVNSFLLHPLEKKEIIIHVKEAGSVIEWKFMVRKKTISFGLFFQESQVVTKEIIPMHEYDTSDGKEENSYKSFSKGRYIAVFENSSSRFSTKEIQYTISVIEPDV